MQVFEFRTSLSLRLLRVRKQFPIVVRKSPRGENGAYFSFGQRSPSLLPPLLEHWYSSSLRTFIQHLRTALRPSSALYKPGNLLLCFSCSFDDVVNVITRTKMDDTESQNAVFGGAIRDFEEAKLWIREKLYREARDKNICPGDDSCLNGDEFFRNHVSLFILL